LRSLFLLDEIAAAAREAGVEAELPR
jgi:hypothetical protein